MVILLAKIKYIIIIIQETYDVCDPQVEIFDLTSYRSKEKVVKFVNKSFASRKNQNSAIFLLSHIMIRNMEGEHFVWSVITGFGAKRRLVSNFLYFGVEH